MPKVSNNIVSGPVSQILLYGCKHVLTEQTLTQMSPPEINLMIVDNIQKLHDVLAQQKSYYDVIIMGYKATEKYTQLIDLIKKFQATAEIMFLAYRVKEREEISLLNMGADYIITGDLTSKKILAYIYASNRRLRKNSHKHITHNTIKLHKDSRTVYRNDHLVPLARREYDLLEALIETPGKIRTRDYLMHYVYGYTTEVDSNALEVHVHQLRKKLYKKLIKTIRGIGYVLE